MFRTTMKLATAKLAIATVLAGLALQTFLPDAGARPFRSNCGCSGPSFGSGYAPSYAAGPMFPSAGVTMMSGGAYGGGGLPNMSYGSSYGFGGTSMPMMAGPYSGGMGMNSPLSSFGPPNYGSASAMPPYYAPVPAQYSPVRPAPATDLVW